METDLVACMVENIKSKLTYGKLFFGFAFNEE